MVIVFTDLARDDLVAIEKYTRKKWGRDQADVYLTQIETRIINLLETPYIGRPRPDVAEGYRCLPEGKHIIFYRVDGDVIYILGGATCQYGSGEASGIIHRFSRSHALRGNAYISQRHTDAVHASSQPVNEITNIF